MVKKKTLDDLVDDSGVLNGWWQAGEEAVAKKFSRDEVLRLKKSKKWEKLDDVEVTCHAVFAERGNLDDMIGVELRKSGFDDKLDIFYEALMHREDAFLRGCATKINEMLPEKERFEYD